MKEILDLDAIQLALKIKSGEITSLEATKIYIKQINKTNPFINAMIEERFTEALAEAKECDEVITNGEAKGRLFGVPISIKEAYNVAGLKTTSGLLHRKDLIEDEDSEVASLLRKEGAIILGKTNTPTLCFCQETDNKIYGKTNNPWNLNFTSGGSSGGEGALIAVGGVAVGIGSDIGGSLRFPGHFNGVITFKSGDDQVSQKGHYLYVKDPYQYSMLGMGAVAKSVNDAELINDIISKQQAKDVEIGNFQITIPNKHPKYPLDEDTEKLLLSIKDFFSASQVVREEFPPMFEEFATIWQLIMSIDGGNSIKKAAEGTIGSFNPFKEFTKEKLTGKSDWHSYLTWALIGTRLFKPSKRQLAILLEKLAIAKQKNKEFLKNNILILPVYHSPAKEHGQIYRELFSITKSYRKYIPYVAYANTLGLPALTIPVGENSAGMPIAFQLVSAVGNEKALFHFGRMLEQSFRGYVRCTEYDNYNG